jgi:hypothetical protein
MNTFLSYHRTASQHFLLLVDGSWSGEAVDSKEPEQPVVERPACTAPGCVSLGTMWPSTASMLDNRAGHS